MNKRQLDALKHEDKLGAGAEKRRKLPPEERAAVIRAEYERGTLHSGSGKIVRNESQMRAIQHSEGHPHGSDHPHNVKAAHKHHKH